MNCQQLTAALDDYLDGSISGDQADALKRHSEACVACRTALEQAQKFKRLLKAYRVPAADNAFYDRALARTFESAGDRHDRRFATGFGAAAAVLLAVGIVSALFFRLPHAPEEGEQIRGVTMALESPHTVNLVFSSVTALDHATLTLILPEGIELQGFAGQREITWSTRLQQGRNLLPLTLVAVRPTGGELLAKLEHDNRHRTFRLRVDVS